MTLFVHATIAHQVTTTGTDPGCAALTLQNMLDYGPASVLPHLLGHVSSHTQHNMTMTAIIFVTAMFLILAMLEEIWNKNQED